MFGYRVKQSHEKTGEMLKFYGSQNGTKTQVFDLVQDPTESNDLSAAQQEAIVSMQTQIRKELGTAAPEGESVDRAEREALRPLGT